VGQYRAIIAVIVASPDDIALQRIVATCLHNTFCRDLGDEWALALRTDADKLAAPYVCPLPTSCSYIMKPGCNDTHEHAVVAGRAARYSLVYRQLKARLSDMHACMHACTLSDPTLVVVRRIAIPALAWWLASSIASQRSSTRTQMPWT
jgi:hypothetical protein